MKKSNFQFSNPVLTDIQFSVNQGFVPLEDKTVDAEIGFELNINKHDSRPEAIVELTIKIGSLDNKTPFYIAAKEGAVFSWDKETSNVDALLQQNAPALLASYMRVIISTLTANSPVGTYFLPFINFKD